MQNMVEICKSLNRLKSMGTAENVTSQYEDIPIKIPIEI
jgi:hypothetical protein